jgi:hypothetical protein
MDAPLATANAAAVRALIARLILGEASTPTRLGTISLAPHQIEAVSRLEVAFDEFGGAFLCDAVGSGKTYIALAVARRMEHPVVVAPAALREMWMTAMKAADCSLRFISVETLSYGLRSGVTCDGVIVDEAHHFRNANTKRYHFLTQLARNQRVLLITATPIHNSRRDFENLAAIFLGTRASHLSSYDITRLVIRRDRTRVRMKFPEVARGEWLDVGDNPAVVPGILGLPPPVPLRNAGEANALLAHGLIRQWASSEAAFITALRRRRARAAALESALEAGEHPTEEEIRRWIAGDDAVQLELTNLFPPAVACAHAELLNAVRTHAAALADLCKRLSTTHFLDDERARMLKQIRLTHREARIVAFASYEATVVALFERLLRSDRVACLTSRGARVAGGRITRRDAVRQFDPGSGATKDSDRIDLLLTTDLLSEGVNLQNASVVVHLDMPWTAARLEQRVGRVARAGSRSSRVTVIGFKPPQSAERALRSAVIVDSKWRCAASSIGAGMNPGTGDDLESTAASPQMHEAVRAILETWRMPRRQASSARLVAAVECDRAGFLAVIENRSGCFLLCDVNGGSTEPSDIHKVSTRACGPEVLVAAVACQTALAQINKWMSARLSTEAAGLSDAAYLRGRRKIFDRINSFVASTAPHARFQRALMIEKVRALSTATLGAEDERSLAGLNPVRAEDFQEDWLATTKIGAKPQLRMPLEPEKYTIRALLLLTPTRAPSS